LLCADTLPQNRNQLSTTTLYKSEAGVEFGIIAVIGVRDVEFGAEKRSQQNDVDVGVSSANVLRVLASHDEHKVVRCQELRVGKNSQRSVVVISRPLKRTLGALVHG
jgi:hypothetical protein